VDQRYHHSPAAEAAAAALTVAGMQQLDTPEATSASMLPCLLLIY